MKHKFTSLGLALAGALMMLPAAASAGYASPPPKTSIASRDTVTQPSAGAGFDSSIFSAFTNSCVDVLNGTTDVNSYIGTAACASSTEQQFTFLPSADPSTPLPNTYILVNKASGLCLVKFRYGVRQRDCATATPSNGNAWELLPLDPAAHTYQLRVASSSTFPGACLTTISIGALRSSTACSSGAPAAGLVFTIAGAPKPAPVYFTSTSPAHVGLVTGESAAPVTLTVQDQAAGSSRTNPSVTWTATPPEGLTVSPASGTLAVPVAGTVSASFSVAAKAGTASGNYSIPITITPSDGTALPAVHLSATTGQPGSLFSLYNSVAISDDYGANDASAVQNFDGAGNSYSESELEAAGVSPGGSVSSGQFSFPWADYPVAQPDNILAGHSGLKVDESSTPAAASLLSFLGSATNGNATGTVTVTYTDGSTQQASIVLADWTLGGGSASVPTGDTQAVKTAYRNNTTGFELMPTYLFATDPIALQPGKRLASVTLPSAVTGGAMHIFSIATH